MAESRPLLFLDVDGVIGRVGLRDCRPSAWSSAGRSEVASVALVADEVRGLEAVGINEREASDARLRQLERNRQRARRATAEAADAAP